MNPKKCRFMVPQGRLLGHVVCKEGLKTDPDKVRVIMEMQPFTNVTEVKSFLGHRLLQKVHQFFCQSIIPAG